MKIYFNSIGIITNVSNIGDSLRQGSVGNVLEAHFEGVDNAYHSAKFNFTRSDGSKVNNVVMEWDNNNAEVFRFVFNDSWFFALAGTTTLTIYLYDTNGNVTTQGQHQFSIESTDYDEEPTITINQYNEIMTALASKLQANTVSVIVNEKDLPDVGEKNTIYFIVGESSNTPYQVKMWNGSEYVLLGTVNLSSFASKEELKTFEKSINEQIAQIRNEVVNPFVVVATESDLPSTNQGKIYVVLDTKFWYYWNGSAYVNGGDFIQTTLSAQYVSYDNSTSGLEATNVQDAIDETKQDIDDFKGKVNYQFESGVGIRINTLSSTFNGWLVPMVKKYAGDRIKTITTVFSLEPSTIPVKCFIMDSNKNIIKEIVKECNDGEEATFDIDILAKTIPSDEFRIGFVSAYTGGSSKLWLAGYTNISTEYNEFASSIETAYTTNGGLSWSWMGNIGNVNYKTFYFKVDYLTINKTIEDSMKEFTYTKDDLTNNTQFGKEKHSNKNLFNIKSISPIGEWYSWTDGLLQKYPDNTYIQNYCHSDFIEIEGGETYTYSGGNPGYPTWIYLSSYCFYDENKNFISGGSISQREQPEGFQLVAPANAKYITLSFALLASAQANVQLEKGSQKTDYQPYYGDIFYLNNVLIKESQIERETKSELIRCADRYDLVVGDTFELFYKGILNAKDYSQYNILCQCDIGKCLSRKFIVENPTTAQVGEHSLAITISDNEGIFIESKNITLNVVNTMSSPSEEKVILCIGDSLTAGGYWVDEFARRLLETTSQTHYNATGPQGLGLTNFNFIGKKTSVGGYNYEGYGGWSYATYLNVNQEDNPFVYNGVIDFTSYCSEMGVSTIDEVFILLGWNSYAKDIDTTNATTFIDILRTFNPNIRITLIGLQIPSLDGCGLNYGAAGSYANYKALVDYVFANDDANKMIAESYESGVNWFNLSAQFDTEYNMPTTTTTPNTRNQTQITIQNNGVHPANSGYFQIADAVYRWFNANN